MGAYRVFRLDFVSHGQSNVEKTSKQITCSYKSIKLDIHATSQTYRVTLARTTLVYHGLLTSHMLPRASGISMQLAQKSVPATLTRRTH